MKVLVVVDMQVDFISGALGTPEAQAIVPKVLTRVREAKANGEKIILTLDTHEAENYMNTVEGKHLPAPHCIRDTEGWHPPVELSEEFQDLPAVLKVNSFGARDLPEAIFESYPEILQGDDPLTEIVLCGLCTDICVLANAIMLKSFFTNPDHPVEISVDASLCAGVTPESHKRALEAMEVLHINVLNKEV